VSEETFDFRVKRAESETNPGWCVSLPHQCDSWDIAGEDGYYGVEHAEAVTRLERFIAEAQSVLTALRGELPHGE
jgi:hypothetical protein